MREKPVKAWICQICGYIHYGDTPPVECPVCGAAQSMFEPYDEAEAPEAASSAVKARCLVIVGAGIAGISAAEAIRKITNDVDVILVSDETELPYYRLNLTRYLDGELKASDLVLHPQQWYQENHIELRLGTTIRQIHLAEKRLSLDQGDTLTYDRLILATGAHSFRPPYPGIERRNVTTLRTLSDADRILENAHTGKKYVCIGGGILGLETAGALARRGAQVTVLEALNWLMPRQLNQAAATIFEQKVRKLGIDILTSVKTRELVGDEAVKGVMLEDGNLYPADVVVISAGVRANVELARAAGLTVNQGIVVNDQMQTSDPNVYAAGDAAEHRGVLYGTWMPAQLQGSIAGMSAVDQKAAFPGVPRTNTLKVLGIELFSIGQIAPEGTEDRMIAQVIGENYYCFIFKQSKLAGSILLGDASLSAAVKRSIEEQNDWPPALIAENKLPAILDAFIAL